MNRTALPGYVPLSHLNGSEPSPPEQESPEARAPMLEDRGEMDHAWTVQTTTLCGQVTKQKQKVAISLRAM